VSRGISMNMQVEQLRTVAGEHRDKISALELQLRGERDALRKLEEKIMGLTSMKEGDGQNVQLKETAMRSLVKAIGWRFTAGFVTFCTSFYFTRSWAAAGAIVGSDFLTKSGTMYIGERLFNKSQAGRSEGGGDNVMRSVVKAIIWRLFAACNTLVASALIMKSRSSSGVAGAAAKIAGVDSVVKTALMVAYDQAWNKVEWGREYEQVNVGGEGI
jgi:uncharacterized membrane protein